MLLIGKKKEIEKCFCGDYLVQMQSTDEVRILGIAIIEPLVQVGLNFQTLMLYPLIHHRLTKVFELIQDVEEILTDIGK